MEEQEKVIIKLKRQPLESERREIKQRRKKRFLVVLLCLLCLCLGAFGGYLYSSLDNHYYYQSTHSKIDKISSILKNNWIYADTFEDIDTYLEDKALYGLTSFDFDPYTTYMSAEELNTFASDINMSFVGIGVTYTHYQDLALITKVYKGAPAQEAGLLEGDIIKAIDGVEVNANNSGDLKSLITGAEGTPVTITVNRQGQILDIQAIRRPVEVTTYAYGEDDYVYLNISSFGESTADECIKYLDELTDYSKIIIDLRDDGGGYLTSVSAVSGLFIGNDQIFMYQDYGNDAIIPEKTKTSKYYDNFKDIVVLVNGNTASAAEVLTMALKERANATVVGTTTYGKGVVQTTLLVENGSALKLTSSKWLSPDKNWINGVGIHPDIEIYKDNVLYETILSFNEGTPAFDVDMVDGRIRLTQMILEYLGYNPSRIDGYFDVAFKNCLISFQKDYGLETSGKLDDFTYRACVSAMVKESSLNKNKDVQLQKAIEVLG